MMMMSRMMLKTHLRTVATLSRGLVPDEGTPQTG
jgi:hypothetical protein